MIILHADRLHWIKDNGLDDPTDHCAHSPVSCQIDDEVICCSEDGDWSVSASAIFLLRALDRDHTMDSKVGGHIFPCCGHGIFDVGESEVVICGCPIGLDFEIRHLNGSYELTTADLRKIVVRESEWKETVVNYSGQILAFYNQSAPKQTFDEEDQKGFHLMMTEWRHLHQKHSKK